MEELQVLRECMFFDLVKFDLDCRDALQLRIYKVDIILEYLRNDKMI